MTTEKSCGNCAHFLAGDELCDAPVPMFIVDEYRHVVDFTVSAERDASKCQPYRERAPEPRAVEPQRHDTTSAPAEPGRRVWRCDNCGKEEPWGDGWGWCGQLHSKATQTERIDFVACSLDCKKQLCDRHKCRAGCDPKL